MYYFSFFQWILHKFRAAAVHLYSWIRRAFSTQKLGYRLLCKLSANYNAGLKSTNIIILFN